MNGNKAPAGSRYFCRGCGEPLPRDWHGQFHPECLQADKRRRTQEKRRLERARLQQWLQRQRCPRCGASLGQAAHPRPDPAREALRAAEPSWHMSCRPDTSS